MPCHHGNDDGCKQCLRNAAQREQRRKNRNHYTKKYEKTPSGFLMRAYRNMRSRVTGVQRKKAHLYQGLSILPREDFYAWAREDPEFWRLFRRWVMSGYEHRLTPSVNRIDPTRGYELDNIEWLTHSINSGLGARSERRLNESFKRLAERAAA